MIVEDGGSWSLILREEHTLRVLMNRLLNKIFGSKREDGAGGGTELHDEELQDMYCVSIIATAISLRTKRWTVHVARIYTNGWYSVLYFVSIYLLLVKIKCF
jgi:hypothetical protein